MKKSEPQKSPTFLKLPGEIRNRIYKELTKLAVEEPSNSDYLVHDSEDPDKITSNPRCYLLVLSKAHPQLEYEVGPLHERFRDFTEVRIRLDQISAYQTLLSGEGDKELASEEPFGDWDDFIVDIDFLQDGVEVDILPF